MAKVATESQRAFIAKLIALKEGNNRELLAALRQRNLSPTADQKVKKAFRRWLENKRGWNRDSWLLVAKLFAHHPLWLAEGETGDMGKHLAHIAIVHQRQGQSVKAIDAKLNNLVTATRDTLPSQLFTIITFLKASEIPVNWLDLLVEVAMWQHSSCHPTNLWVDSYIKYMADVCGDENSE